MNGDFFSRSRSRSLGREGEGVIMNSYYFEP